LNLLVVEDERRVADVRQRGLRAEGFTVILAADGEAARKQLEKDHFDVVVLDLMLPGISGQEVCQRMRARQNFTPVLMLSALDQTDDRVSGLQLGADDYLVKPFDFDELVARIQALVRRARLASAPRADARVLRFGGVVYDTRSLEVTSDGEPVVLTDTERGVLHLLLAAPDRIHSRERILNAVWGSTEDPLTNIVDVYIARLRKKLGESGRMIETVRGTGYRLKPDHR